MRDHHGPRHVVGRLVGPCYVLTDGRHLLGSLGEDGLGDPRGADGRRNTGEVSHLLSSVLYVDRLGVPRLLFTSHGVEGTVDRPEYHAPLRV